MQLEIKNGWMEESMCRERKERRTGGVEGGEENISFISYVPATSDT